MKLLPKGEKRPWGTYTYLLADLGFVESRIANGYLGGDTLEDVMETYFERMVGDSVYDRFGRQFPLSVSMLEVGNETSPVTVCPDDETAASRYDALGKKKIWYVASASAGAKIYLGLSKPADASELYSACRSGNLTGLLNEIPVKEGDSFVIEPGTLHAAHGVTILEISEASGLDFEIFGSRRSDISDEDVLVEALDFIDLRAYNSSVKASGADNNGTEAIAFREYKVEDVLHFYSEHPSAFAAYACVKGSVSVQVPESGGGMQTMLLGAGEAAIVPAEVNDYYILPIDRNSLIIETWQTVSE